MKTLYLFLILLFLITTAAAAQTQGGRVSGKLIDANTGEVIDFATIALYQNGSDNMFRGTSSNDGGVFNLFNIPNGNYNLRISFVGYEKQIIEHIDISATKLVANVGTLRLKPSGNQLAEVTISDKKSPIEYTADQITYNVGESLQAEGSVATDILKNVPMVNVDIDGKATIAGKRNTRIFIDGKPSDYMTSNITDLLNVLPSEAIDKIEVMTNPPAKYSADGDGIINIVLKKGFKVGLNGTLAITGGSLGNYNINGYSSYRTKTLSINASYAFGQRQLGGDSYSLQQNFPQVKDPADPTRLKDTLFFRNNYSDRDGHNLGHNFRTGFNWDIDSTQNLRFSANLAYNDAFNGAWTDYHFLDNRQIESNLNKQASNSASNSFSYVLDATYSLKLGKSGEQLEASATWSAGNSGNNRLLARNYLDGNGLPVTNRSPFEQTYDILGGNTNLHLLFNYDKPLGKPKNSLSVGVDALLRTTDNDQLVNNFDFGGGFYYPHTGLTNRFNFTGNVYSSFASLNLHTNNNWSFRIGGRAELTDMRFDLAAQGNTQFSIKPYVNVFPNLSASRMFKNKYTIGVSYNERITRPREQTLSPQIETADSINYNFGNPNLRPSYTRQADLSLGWYEKKWSVYPRLSYANTTAIIERVTTVTDGITRNTYANLSSSQMYTFNLWGNYRPSKRLNLNGGGTVGSVVYQSSSANALRRNGVTLNGRVGMTMDFAKRLSFEGNLSYFRNASAQGNNGGRLTSSFGLRKVFMNNKLKFRIMAADPFNQNVNRIYTEGVNFTKLNHISTNTRNFSATISYNFTKVGRNSVNKQKKDGGAPDVQP